MREMAEVEESSENSEQVLDDDVDDIEFDSNGIGLEENDVEIDQTDLGLHGDDLDDNTLDIEHTNVEIVHHDFDVDENELENDIESEPVLGIECRESNADGGFSIDGQFRGKEYVPPVVGMEFDSYDDAYNYYNCYAKELGFAIRVKSSWTKRNSKEKRGAVLCCNCEGFKTVKEANTRRKETRTGCLAMIRLRLVESNRWRVDEVKLEHNHLFDLERAQNSKSHKKMDVRTKRKVEPAMDVEVRTIKLYRTATIDPMSHGSSNSYEGESPHRIAQTKRLKFKRGDSQIIHDYFRRVQLTNPNFFYLMDLNDEGFLRNVFWIDSRSRAAYGYFSDVVIFDSTCLSDNYEVPFFAFTGLNHHRQSILLGCGLLADETLETYIWLFRAWLTCILGRPPQVIITDRGSTMQNAIAEVFPRARHRVSPSYAVQRILDNLVSLQNFESFRIMLNAEVYDSLKVDEFEMAWGETIQRFGLADHEWLRSLYEDRERWVPVYSKDLFLAGAPGLQRGESMIPFLDGYMHQQTSLKEFFDVYDLVLGKKHQKEALDDLESTDSTPALSTTSYYELQLSKVYTNEIFHKFQEEVAMMSSCFSATQINANGSTATYVIKDHEGEGNLRDVKNFEVVFDKAGTEVRCSCNCFNFKGYLCRHALCILSYNGVEEIPFQYILPRWRKDFKRLYVANLGSNNVDIANPVQWFDHLYRRAMQVVEEGMVSQDHYMVAWQAFKESLNKVRLVADKHVF